MTSLKKFRPNPRIFHYLQRAISSDSSSINPNPNPQALSSLFSTSKGKPPSNSPINTKPSPVSDKRPPNPSNPKQPSTNWKSHGRGKPSANWKLHKKDNRVVKPSEEKKFPQELSPQATKIEDGNASKVHFSNPNKPSTNGKLHNKDMRVVKPLEEKKFPKEPETTRIKDGNPKDANFARGEGLKLYFSKPKKPSTNEKSHNKDDSVVKPLEKEELTKELSPKAATIKDGYQKDADFAKGEKLEVHQIPYTSNSPHFLKTEGEKIVLEHKEVTKVLYGSELKKVASYGIMSTKKNAVFAAKRLQEVVSQSYKLIKKWVQWTK